MIGKFRFRSILSILLLLPALLVTTPLAQGAHPQQPSPQMLVLTENLAPYNYLKNNMLQGVCTEVVRELISRTGTSLPQGIRVLPWSRAISMAKTLPNVALFSTTRSPQREELFHWVGPIYTSQVVMLKQCDSPVSISSLENAKPYRIGVLQDYVEEDFLRHNDFPHIYSVPGTPEQMVYLLAHSRIDLWLQSLEVAIFYANRAGKPAGWLKVALPVQQNALYIAFSKGTNPEIIKQWNIALQDIKRDGTYDGIIRRFGEGLAAGTPMQFDNSKLTDKQRTPDN